MALAGAPGLLLLDEPLTALDAKLKESLRDELAELLRRLHITAIHVTHDQVEAMAIADKVVLLDNGVAAQVGRFTGRRIDLDLKDADIHNVLRLLADVGKINVITADTVNGSVTNAASPAAPPVTRYVPLKISSRPPEISRKTKTIASSSTRPRKSVQ